MTYESFFTEREPAPAAQRRSDGTWTCIRQAYGAGESAPRLAERHGVSVSAIRTRAREEGWRRTDAPDPEPGPGLGPEPGDDADALADAGGASPAELRGLAWARAALAVRRGRLADALGWTRLVRQLDALAEKQAAGPALQARAAASLARAADSLTSLRRILPEPPAPEVHDLHDLHGPSHASGDEPCVLTPAAHPRAGGDPDLFAPGELAADVANLAPRLRGDERNGKHEVHDLHGPAQASGDEPCVLTPAAHPRGCGDPDLFAPGELAADVANLAPRLRGDERNGGHELHGLHGPAAPPEPSPPPFRPPRGPAMPLHPPAWARERLGMR